MPESNLLFFDGQKAVNMNDPAVWTILSGDEKKADIDKLYSVVAWLYRCVNVRGNSVASMPFEIRRGDTVIYEFDGSTAQDAAPRELPWIGNLPFNLAKVEIANCLGGRAYLKEMKNVLDSPMMFKWMVPWSIEPLYNEETGELLAFKRTYGKSIRKTMILEPEEVIHFWLPDYAVENGPALNYPGRAVLQNAGVVSSLDMFLKGYFDRGMIKATLLKYKDAISQDEKVRVKEWWRRAFLGIANAFNSEVVRGDFETVQLGDGIKDLRDDTLNTAEKNSIAIGLGVPLSKVDSSTATDSNRNADDRQYIEETIIPEIGWIYRVCNERIFNPMGYSIVAKPQELRVMQTDEVERSEAFRNYVGDGKGSGLPVATAVSVLGIYIAEGLEVEQERPQAPPMLPMQVTNGNTPQDIRTEAPTRSLDAIALLDKRDERDQFIRWLKNRLGGRINPNDFKSEHLTMAEKITIIKQFEPVETTGEIPPVPVDVTPDEADQKAARRDWDKKMPKHRGLLNAEVIDE